MIEPINVLIDNNQDDVKNCSFHTLLKFQSIFGVTYFGTCDDSRGNDRAKRIFFIVYDLSLLVIFALIEYYLLGDEADFSDMFLTGSDRIVIRFLFYLTGYVLMIQFLTVKIVTLVNGPKIIKTIEEISEYSLLRMQI